MFERSDHGPEIRGNVSELRMPLRDGFVWRIMGRIGRRLKTGRGRGEVGIRVSERKQIFIRGVQERIRG